MKKILLIAFGIIFVAIAAVYILIPREIRISNVVTLDCTKKELTTCLHDQRKWPQWLKDPSDSSIDPPTAGAFTDHGYRYQLTRELTNGAEFSLQRSGLSMDTHLEAFGLQPDSIALVWNGTLPAGYDPFTRVSRYFEAFRIKRNLYSIMGRLARYAARPVNVYGFDIRRRTGFGDTLLIAAKNIYDHYPATGEIYKDVAGLKNRLTREGARAVNHPMFNIEQQDSSRYRLMVAIAIDKMISVDRPFFIIRMPHTGGKFVTADVKGGPSAIKEAHAAIEDYMMDHQLTSPGISFEIMITDRSRETDTTQWITQIYQPST